MCSAPNVIMLFFKPEHLTAIDENRATFQSKYNRVLLKFTHFRFEKENAREYAQQGFMRRFGTLQQCIENTFKLIPPETETFSIEKCSTMHQSTFKHSSPTYTAA